MQPSQKGLPFLFIACLVARPIDPCTVLSLILLLSFTFGALVQSRVAYAAPYIAPKAFANDSTTIFINEVHYDDAGADIGEFVEIAGPVGANVSGWTIQLYNGSATDRKVYSTFPLPAAIPASPCPYGFAHVDTLGIQNGAPDAIALVNNTGQLVQFLSYEGTFTGLGGPADSVTSTDIGVSEDGSEPEERSLQLFGEGTTYGDLEWKASSPWSPGAPNTGEALAGCDIPPTVTNVTPAGSSSGVELFSNLTVKFSEEVSVTDPWFTITCANSGTHSATISGGPQSYTLDPDVDFTPNESCSVTLKATQIADLDGTPQPLAADFSWNFTTLVDRCSENTETKIHAIQGSGTTSTLAGSTVAIKGVVVGEYQGDPTGGGFFVQEEDGDADSDPLTSEGIFVFRDAPVRVGDLVRLQGVVSEFGNTGVTLTELINATLLQICAAGGSVTPIALNLPAANANAWEPFEGMVVTLPQQLTVTDNFQLGRFGESVLSSGGRLYQPTNVVAPGAPALAMQATNNLNRIVLDDAQDDENPDPVIYPQPRLSADNTLRTGYTVTGVQGILDQRFGSYRIQQTAIPTFAATNPRTSAPENVGGRLKVASANVLNYFTTLDQGGAPCGPTGGLECRGANTAAERDRQRAKIVAGLGAINADIIGLLELQNNSTASIEDLVNGLNAIPGVGPYAYINTGTIGTDAIKVGLIYKPASVAPLGPYKILDHTVDPNFRDNLNRPTLAQTFQENATTERFTVAVNHLKSKGSDCNTVGDPDTGDGQGNCNQTRKLAAAALVKWLATDPTGSGDPDFLIIGDLNSYALEEPITTIKNAGYTDLINRFHPQGAYSYVFQAQSGYLDHGLANASLNAQVTGAADWHVNTDEPVVLDYNTEFKSADQIDYFYSSEPYRFSDHDPLVIGLDLKSETTITIVKDANPHNVRNFRFSGDLGEFRLDDPALDDHDGIASSKTFNISGGSYTVSEDVPYFWHLTHLVCKGGDTTVDLAHERVTINIIAGQKVTCTFTNEYGSNLLVSKYNDRNANGRRNLELPLPSWKISLYDQAESLVAAGETNILGLTLFANIAPGNYTLCETQRSGWSNSQPGTTNPTYHQPCYSLTIGPAQLWSVEFGNYRDARAAGVEATTPDQPAPDQPTVSPLQMKNVDDESYEDDGAFIDPKLLNPEQGGAGTLFLPQITH